MRVPFNGKVGLAGFVSSCLLLIVGWQQWRLSGIEGTLSRLSRVLLEEKRNSSSSTIGPVAEENLTRDCVTWTPLPTQYSPKKDGKSSPSPVEKKRVTESDIHRKESFQKSRRVLDHVVKKVKEILNKESVTLLDSSCGDMAWMPTFLENRTDVIFTGYDIVPGNVEGHKKKFEGKPWNFEVHDIVADPIGKYDMILSRHTLQHLKTGDVERVIANFAKSGSTFLLTTNFPTAKKNTDLSEDTQYRYRPVNLLLEPYFLPRPMCDSLDIKNENIHIALWDLEKVRSQSGRRR